MTQENPIVIKNREELIFVLSEAAMLEHMIMCEYLFAAFSLKSDVSEGVTAPQLEAIKRWERAVSHVATQEMLHLALVSNLLSSLGSLPFFYRPNFPQRSRYFPSTVQLALLPFGQDALQHFLYLERPEGIDLKDAPEFQLFANAASGIALDDDQVVPSLQEFATVGHLYRGIEHGFRLLVDKYGEQRVFIGPSRAQATQQYFGWPELVAVADLASAVQAIETIVEQGEGARGDWQTSHYGQFFSIAQEYRSLKQQDPGFEPARPAVPAYAKPPSDTSEAVLITDPLAASVSELFNACYEVMLQMITRYFIHGSDNEEELRILSGTAVDMMFVAIKPLGELLTRLPVGPDLPGKVAGPNFEIFHTGYILPHRHAAWAILHERLLEIASFCTRLGENQSTSSVLTAIEADVRKLATRLEPYLDRS
jgi:hypothetical protein